jgi:hypothetical protein
MQELKEMCGPSMTLEPVLSKVYSPIKTRVVMSNMDFGSLAAVATFLAVDMNGTVVAWSRKFEKWYSGQPQRPTATRVSCTPSLGSEPVIRRLKDDGSDASDSGAVAEDAIVGETAQPKSEGCCAMCGNRSVKLFRCGRCHQVKYCSRDCQVVHWGRVHKKECKPSEERE